MVDTSWVPLLVSGTLLLIGFAAALVFHRFRFPDFIVLLLLGAGLSLIPFPPFGQGLYTRLLPVLPLFTQLTIAFILFEGGLSLRFGGSGRSIPGIVAHGVVAMGATAVLMYFGLTSFLGLSTPTALVVAIAFSGPSASIALSFATRMHLDPRAEAAIVLEGVLTNVIAVIGVLVVLQWYGAPGSFFFLPYLAQVGEAALFGAVIGYAWARVVHRLAGQRFVYIGTIALAIAVYAAAQGFLGETGAVSVFALGILLGHGETTRAAAPTPAHNGTSASPADAMLQELTRFVEATEGPAGPAEPASQGPAQSLRSFSSEITFALRTFFFVTLGLLLTTGWGGLGTWLAAGILVVAFLLGRLPSSLALGWGMALYPRDTRAIFASMARGMTDVVLILFASQSGILPQTEVNYVLGIVPAIVLLAAIVSAILVVWAGHSPGEAEAKALLQKGARPAAAATAVRATAAPPSRTGLPPAPTPSGGSPHPAQPQGPPPGAAGRSPPGRRGAPPRR